MEYAIIASTLCDKVGMNRQFLANLYSREALDSAKTTAPVKLLRIEATAAPRRQYATLGA